MTDFNLAFSMPNRWTFQMKPVLDLFERWDVYECTSIDPFAGQSTIATYCNDLGAGGKDAESYCDDVLLRCGSHSMELVLFDPPYSPRQISECYKSVGIQVTKKHTQNAALYARVRRPLDRLLKPGGLVISFGWSSTGFGKRYETLEVLLIQHGGAHNDTICVVQRKPEEKG